MQDFTSIDRLQNATVYGNDGDKIGNVGQVYLDDQTNQPTFVTVKTGLFGTKETFIPVAQATEAEDGLTVPFDKDFVKDAPNIDADGSLTPEEEQRIYEYYSLDYQSAGAGMDRGVAGEPRHAGQDGGLTAEQATPTGTAAGAGGLAGMGAARDTNDVAAADLETDVNRDRGFAVGGAGADSESVVARNEELDVHTERQTTGQVRLRKHVHNDTETVEVPVTREEVSVEREAIDPNSPEARAGTGDEDVVVTTHEDVPVVDKNVTAEKVSVDKDTVQETQPVSGEVRHEEVDVEGDRGTTDGGRGRRA